MSNIGVALKQQTTNVNDSKKQQQNTTDGNHKSKSTTKAAAASIKKDEYRENHNNEDFEDVGGDDRSSDDNLNENFEDYDDCKDIVDELKTRAMNNRSNLKSANQQQQQQQQQPMKPLNNTNNPVSGGDKDKFLAPLKKRNNENSIVEESPKKRTRVPEAGNRSSNQQEKQEKSGDSSLKKNTENLTKTIPTNLAISSFKNRLLSPKKQRSSSLCEPPNDAKKSMASTPKSERKAQSRVKQLVVDSAAYERNLSNSWADIIEEVEEQSKELNEYIEKVMAKYKLEKEVLMKNLECDTDVLRKRQKRINFGKVTPEYQRYISQLAKKDRKPFHPRTPNKFRKCSRRKFDGLIKKWRKLLHVWDENPDDLINFKNSLDTNESPEDYTDDFGCTSNINASNFSYIVDDYDIIDDEESTERNGAAPPPPQ